MKFRPFCALAALLIPGLAACTYSGDIDNPATIKATWFSYVNGDDIREGCVEGSAPRYRLIYNADYNEQLRSYEITGNGAGGAAMTVRVQGKSGIATSRIDFSDPLAWARWTKSEAVLDAQALGRLDEALTESGAFDPAPAGLRLFSKETYWVSSLCKDGVFSFNAWRYPSERFEEITFDAILFAEDATEIAVRPPRIVSQGERSAARMTRNRQSRDETGSTFNLLIGENGLARGLVL